MASIDVAIINNTLGDDAAFAELFKRQSQYAVDSNVADDLRLQGQGIFNDALFTAGPAAMQSGKPVVAVLRQTIESIGALYLQNEQRESTVSNADNPGDVSQRLDALDIEVQAANTAQSHPQQTTVSDDMPEKRSSTPERLSIAYEARKKRRLATHGTQGRMAAAAGVKKALQGSSHAKKLPRMLAALEDSEGKKISDNAPRIEPDVRSVV